MYKYLHLTILTQIGNSFLYRCTSLKTLILPPTIKYIGQSFLGRCTNINLSQLINLTNYDNLFLNKLLVFVQVNKSMKWKLEYKLLVCSVSNEPKLNSIKEKSLYHFTTYVALNVSLNIRYYKN
jgi:hypothetical protein